MEIKGDFLGFSFNGVRSEELGIVRTSDGDNFTENLQPEIKDVTAEVPGMHGAYYFGSTFGVKNISVSFAFDDLTELQFRKLRQVFGQRKQGELIFDERPYKKYIAKIESPIELSYVCFDEPIKEEQVIEGIRYQEDGEYKTSHIVMRNTNQTGRIYKGDGKIEFVCYFPFAKSVFKELPDEHSSEEWVASSGILTENLRETYQLDNLTAVDGQENTYQISVYNPGDIETGFRLYCPFEESNDGAPSISLTLQLIRRYSEDEVSETEIIDTLNIQNCKKKGNDVGIVINTDNNLIQGVSEAPRLEDGSYIWTTSKNIYNSSVTSGNFFKINPSFDPSEYMIILTGGNNSMQIFYDYLYF